ncbi:molybdate ABC transporter substrate-binding protein [Rhodoferax sp.]|uniref:molybdate ABC transporter substrate-binding protein n=1 Tax=Rhodoferax sp. TaxID=50421 RepID=UPI0027162E64|nr:molybdate ABC transporter substrate-binding protein [Rhodoferax sp.]MDO9198853.1 molybdate ABC transporter substrate-binding protein [Rhodoferax sp.]
MGRRVQACLILLALWSAAQAAEAQSVVRVAVAANFASPLKALAADFEKDTGHKMVLSAGATAKLYAQIKSGAPFDVFLAADDQTPARLEKEGDAVARSRFTYATGKLVLWSALSGTVDAQGEVLKSGNFKHLALAAPKLAPYGAAAIQTLTRLALMDRLQARLVQGESIGQTYSFVASGNAELGFVALSQVYENGRITKGSGWIVPAHLYDPLRQDAVMLVRGSSNPAASALLAFLKTGKTRTVIRSFGYETE